ncbi:tyrosine-type recombinase/integrase [Terrihalobacillus insolitus]|uniref:tyrosine-type recombinase/integrase n=1 Tax=Terrihalobacillus insolitus TaxID=2950438 RepID=UPI0023407DFF|nr:tyrosine-type recombinase/integrase [Terrihalobacillus insolitus]MDC3413979.1 tyrosine-type recombinase/integrase [Terrihalobacillus insolitus]
MRILARRTNKIVQVKEVETEIDSFDHLFHLFVRDCKLRNLSEHTIQYYRNELTKFMKKLEKEGYETQPSKITKEDIEDYVLQMMNDNKKETTINANLRAIRSFFNFLEKECYIIKNPAKNLKLVKQKRTVIQTFSRDQIMLLLRQPDTTTFTGFRDYTMMMLLLETGVRVKELCGIRVNDINWTDSVVTIREAKGFKERNVPIQRTMKKQLMQYQQIRGKLEHDILFVNIDNEPIAIRAVQSAIAKYGRMAGIKDVRCSPHTFRHTFAKMSVQNGADVFTLQSVLGHSSMDMVRNYVNMFSNELRDNHRKFSPIEKLF